MNRRESPHFLAFVDRHFGPKEQVAYLLQVQEVWAGSRRGRIEMELTTQDGQACVTYFYFDQEDRTLYVLAAYLIRKGEPRPSEVEVVEKYIRDIQSGGGGWE